jgi:cytochrome P450
MLFANLDVTSAVTSWVITHIGQHPRVQDKLRNENQSILGNSPTVEDIVEHFTKLKYLDCVVKESARLQPILAISFPERTVATLSLPNGNIIPAEVNTEQFLLLTLVTDDGDCIFRIYQYRP